MTTREALLKCASMLQVTLPSAIASAASTLSLEGVQLSSDRRIVLLAQGPEGPSHRTGSLWIGLFQSLVPKKPISVPKGSPTFPVRSHMTSLALWCKSNLRQSALKPLDWSQAGRRRCYIMLSLSLLMFARSPQLQLLW